MKKKTEVDDLTLPTIMLSNTSSNSEDMTITPLMAFLMSWRLCRITRVSRLNRISSWFRTVFMDSSYLTGNLFYKVRREKFSLDDMLLSKKIWPITFVQLKNLKFLNTEINVSQFHDSQQNFKIVRQFLYIVLGFVGLCDFSSMP